MIDFIFISYHSERAGLKLSSLSAIRRDVIGTDDQKFMNDGIAVSAPEARMNLNQVLAFVPQIGLAVQHLANTYRVPKSV